MRIGVPEFTNKTAQTVNTRTMRQQLIAQLSEAKLDAVPMAAAAPEELQTRAQTSATTTCCSPRSPS